MQSQKGHTLVWEEFGFDGIYHLSQFSVSVALGVFQCNVACLNSRDNRTSTFAGRKGARGKAGLNQHFRMFGVRLPQKREVAPACRCHTQRLPAVQGQRHT